MDFVNEEFYVCQFLIIILISIRRGLVVRISAFHAGGPGSIPGVGILFLYESHTYFFLWLSQNNKKISISTKY